MLQENPLKFKACPSTNAADLMAAASEEKTLKDAGNHMQLIRLIDE